MKRCRPLLGTLVEIESDAPGAIDCAFAAVERVHVLMSAHDPASELSQINRLGHRQRVIVSEWTAAVIARGLFWSKASAGAFDIVRAGRAAFVRGAVPHHQGQPLPADADWTAVSIIESAVTLERPACLDLGGIAKGFAVDRAVDALKAAGAARGLVNAGGDMRGFGDEPWPISVVDALQRRPLAMIEIVNCALATSAGLRNGSGGLSFEHLPPSIHCWTSVTVRAPDACDADALTKIVWAGVPGAVGLLRGAAADAFAIDADGRLEAVGCEARAA